MQFYVGDQEFCLKGIPQAKLKVVEGQPSCKFITGAAQLCVLHVTEIPEHYIQFNAMGNQSASDPPELHLLKEKFQDIFADPNSLPPLRGVFDHKIPLLPEVSLVNIRPYRYPLKQRVIIEQLIHEMLDRGIIQKQ
jgi:hypothetical protein